MNFTYALPINDVERDLLNELGALTTDNDGIEVLTGMTREESIFYIDHGKARVNGAPGTPEDNAEYDRLSTLQIQARSEVVDGSAVSDLTPEIETEVNDRNILLTSVSEEVAPMRDLLWELHSALPVGSKQNMSDEHRTILDAGFRLSRHLFGAAAEVFKGLTPTASNPEWAAEVAYRIRTLELQLDATTAEIASIH